MKVKNTLIDGCFVISFDKFIDKRGCFVKYYEKNNDIPLLSSLDFVEEYFTVSNENVIRGMHIQVPPFEQEKIVYCTNGVVLDVVLDLRKKSHTYGMFYETLLDATSNFKMLYIPKGVAHGFFSLRHSTVLNYKVTSKYNSDCDVGVHWNSFNMKWPINDPIISTRDKSFVDFNNFDSPF